MRRIMSKSRFLWRVGFLAWLCEMMIPVIGGTSHFESLDVLNNHETESGIVTIPLVPHHVQKSRRRALQSDNDVPFAKTPRPSRYPRWLEEDYNDEGTDSSITDRGQPSAEQVSILFQGYGTHYADLWCGTPPQRQTVIVDTGSGITAFPCEQCTKCGVPEYHIDQLFEESKSSSYKLLQCNECLKGSCDVTKQHCKMGQSYQEGSSWYAYEVQDLCYVGGVHSEPLLQASEANDAFDPYRAPSYAFNMKFGCQDRITGLFITQLADGIMGMDKAEASFWKQMYSAGKIKNRAFSLCFGRSPTAAREGTEAGAMSMGGTDVRLHKTPMVYTSNTGSSGFYRVRVRKVYLRSTGGGDTAAFSPQTKVVPLDVNEEDLNSGSVIVDSGTTDTYFHRKMGTQFYRVFEDLTGEKYDHKERKMTKEQVDAYPTILFQLYGEETLNRQVAESNKGPVTALAGQYDPDHPYDVILAVPPSHYFEYDEEEDRWSARFYADENRGSVLGANSMMGHDVLFDIDRRILGWAESDCHYSELASKFVKPDAIIPEPHQNDEVDPAREGEATDDRFKPEDPKIEEKLSKPEPEFCTSFSCQIGFTITLVATVVLVGWRLARTSSSTPMMQPVELSEAELEMQSPPSASIRSYRDVHDEEGRFT